MKRSILTLALILAFSLGSVHAGVLHHAADDQDLPLMQTAVKNGADPNAKDWEGNTALHLLARNGYVAGIHFLVKNGADVNSRNDDLLTPLHVAAYSANVPAMHVLLSHRADLEVKGNYKAARPSALYGATPLHMAAYNGYFPAVDILLEAGADVNARDDYLQTPLHWAAAKGHVPAIQFLLKARANVRAKDEFGRTALHRAASAAHVPVMHVLLSHGADVNAKARGGARPLHEATLSRSFEVDNDRAHQTVEVLLKARANVNVYTISGYHKGTPLHNAVMNHRAMVDGYVGIIELLLEYGADVNAKGNYSTIGVGSRFVSGSTPLFFAKVFNAHPAVIKVLLKAGGKVAAKYIEGNLELVNSHGQTNEDHANANHCVRHDRLSQRSTLGNKWWELTNICKRDIILFYCFNESCGREGSYFKEATVIRRFSRTRIKLPSIKPRPGTVTTTMESIACYSSRHTFPPKNLDKHETCSIYPIHSNKDEV